MRVVVYARTSGDEADTGQNVQAQGKHTADKARELGHEVAAIFLEDGVSGSVPASQRRVWLKAVARAEQEGAGVVVREVSRFSRFAPHGAMVELDHLPVPFVSLKEPHFADSGQADPSNLLLRFVSLWQAWAELHGIQAKTQAAMDDLAAGRRATKSGKAVGRPKAIIEAAHIEAARLVYAKDGLAAAHREVLRLRGHGDALDPATKAKRYVGKETVAVALGLRSAEKAVPPKTQVVLEAAVPGGNGSVSGGGGRLEIDAQSERPQEREASGASDATSKKNGGSGA